MSDGGYALPYRTRFDLRLTWARPVVRAIGEGAMWLAGGIVFAATAYMVVALPGILE